MTLFQSTRGTGPLSFSQALFQGLAPDGGLYVPMEEPSFGTDAPPGGHDFPRTAIWAARALLGEAVSHATLERITAAALDFDVPLVEVEPGIHILELFHGPSLAFKDVGARFMARAMAELSDEGRLHTVLVATSGDTGGAVAAAFHGVPGTRVVTLFPRGGISDRQRRQMSTLGGNVTAVAVDGTFDDCQRLAKEAFADVDLRERVGLTSANSINIGRLIPQAFYYLHAAALLRWEGPPPTFVVPSGNLGNLCAGLLAHRAGMPAAGFVAATNANRVFVDYLETGRYTPVPSRPTLSNAMDVGAPSNLERIRWLYGDSVDRIREDMRGIAVGEAQTEDTIRDVHARTGYVLDPHGAVGWTAMERIRTSAPGPVVVLATAHPCKFPDVVERATGKPVSVPQRLAQRLDQPERVVDLPASLLALRAHLLDEATP